ncbi:anti-sigma factor [Burkholderia metallica]|uniref:anti-sigma factor n=1 Tax=Burkholderia metallica TaxID=488729 RepID=UPI001CF315B5|nr:anti-sigma factor [Burkholderia metallica]MCA8003289.1 anti-sigma factor [Burkholderia metallica]
MRVDDVMLMAYVDGELGRNEEYEVTRVLAKSRDMANRVGLLRASILPYQHAFAYQNLPPVPEALKRNVAVLARAHADKATQITGNVDAVANNEAAVSALSHGNLTDLRTRMRTSGPWLAVAFVAGAFCCGATLRLMPTTLWNEAMHGETLRLSGEHNASPWVVAAATYQALYFRDTVAVTTDPAISERTVSDIRMIDRLPIHVPDLSAQGLTFKRIQRLRFHGKPLVQIVYLPENGNPVALCIVKDPRPDQPLVRQRLDEMNAVTWRRSELSYALIGAAPVGNLNDLARMISDHDFDMMFEQASLLNSSVEG